MEQARLASRVPKWTSLGPIEWQRAARRPVAAFSKSAGRIVTWNVVSFHAAQPCLAPPRIGASRAEEDAPDPAFTAACDTVEDQAVALECLHLSRRLVDEALDPGEDAARLTAMRDHLGIEREAPVSPVCREGLGDLFSRSHANEVARSKAEVGRLARALRRRKRK